MNLVDSKQPFDIDLAISQLREAVRPYPKAALFELADRGHRSAFEQLVACIISIRTRDETTLPVACRLFQRARTPQEMVQLTTAELDALIQESTYHESKAPQILAIAQRLLDQYDGELPCEFETLVSFTGVGPKCANLVLGIACAQPCISVDVHVQRVTNRWGYVQTRTPEKTRTALEATLPQHYWVELNQLLVPFGKHLCTGELPRCSTCALRPQCQQIGVSSHR